MDIPNQKYYLRVRCRLYPANERKRSAGRVHDQPAIHIHEKESVSMPTAKLTGEKRIPNADIDIREISYTIMKDGEEMTYFKRFIFRDNCMYQLTIGGKTEDLEELNSQRDKFFNSVKFDQNTRK